MISIPIPIPNPQVGLSDLWNKVIRYGITNGYEHVFVINNDVLIGDGTIGSLVAMLKESDASLVLPTTRQGAGSMAPRAWAAPGTDKDGRPGGRAYEPRKASNFNFIGSPLSFNRLQSEMNAKLELVQSGPEQGKRKAVVATNVPSFMAFFWGVKAEWVKAHLLPDGTGRLFNNTRWMNYGQEAHLKNTHPDMNIAGCLNSFAYHYRGSTLVSGACKNGWLDCAPWQKNHRPDMLKDAELEKSGLA